MKAMLCEKFGPPENLLLKEVADLNPSHGQVRISTEACGVNFPDTLIIENKYQFKPQLPFAPGGEVTGIAISAIHLRKQRAARLRTQAGPHPVDIITD